MKGRSLEARSRAMKIAIREKFAINVIAKPCVRGIGGRH